MDFLFHVKTKCLGETAERIEERRAENSVNFYLFFCFNPNPRQVGQRRLFSDFLPTMF